MRIGDREYEVILNKNGGRDNGTDSSAHCSHWHQRIWIDLDGRKIDGIEGDLWHEIFEMIDKNENLQLDHKTITKLSNSVHQVLIDNKEYFDNLEELVKEVIKK